jgi:excisionase family DNA binding protein
LPVQGKPLQVVVPMRTAGSLMTASSQREPTDRPFVESNFPDDSAPRPEPPMRVKEAAKFLGVSPQTVYLWVERKQIPHLRVMGRNIRFLRSELEPFRAKFKQEVVEWQDR